MDLRFRQSFSCNNQTRLFQQSQELSGCTRRFAVLLILFFSLTLVSSGCETNSTSIPVELQGIVDRVGKQYVPDSRVDVYRVDLKKIGRGIILTGEIINPDLSIILLDSLQHATSHFTFIDSIRVLPDSSVRDQSYGIVRISVANMRRAPKYQAELINQTILGTVVRILKEERGFFYIQNWDKYLGWITKGSVVAVDSATAKLWQNAPQVVSTANYGIVRAQAGTSDDFIVDLVPGARLKLVSKGYSSYKVETPDGRIGFVQKEWVAENEEVKQISATRDRVVRTSKRFLGVPYLWGGTSVKGFDCSGFVQTVFRLNNMPLPRDANQIALMGETVELSEKFDALFPGDLLFFGSNPERITHCGIYLGNRLFIHSDGSVHINSLDPEHPLYNEYRHKTLRKSKRIL